MSRAAGTFALATLFLIINLYNHRSIGNDDRKRGGRLWNAEVRVGRRQLVCEDLVGNIFTGDQLPNEDRSINTADAIILRMADSIFVVSGAKNPHL